jgi:hypothetical protein
MTSLPDKIAGVGLRLLPAPIARRLQTEAGKRLPGSFRWRSLP